MNDIRRVGVGQGIRNLRTEINGTPRVHRQASDHAFQRFARSKLEDKKRFAVLIADLIERGDIRVRQRECRAGIAKQGLAASGIRLKRVGRHFDRDGPAKPRVTGAIDVAESARADSLEDSVVTKGVDHDAPGRPL